MSYEGHTQNICPRGHYFECDAYVDPVCACGDTPVWTNPVDDTNCDSYGVVPPNEIAKLLVKEAVVECCNLGHPHVMEEAVYRSPQEGEVQRYYRPWDSSDLIPL